MISTKKGRFIDLTIPASGGTPGPIGPAGPQGKSGTNEVGELYGMFKQGFNNSWTKYTKLDGNLVKIEVWDGPGKLTKLFTKELFYSDGALSRVELTDHISGKQLLKDYFIVNNELDSGQASII